MTSLSLVGRVRENPALSRYFKVAFAFVSYLRATAECSFKLHGERYCDEDGETYVFEREMEWIHRWTETYRKAVQAKFYQLESWLKSNPCPVTMLSLTTYQDGLYSTKITGDIVSIPASFDLLKSSWKRLRMALRQYLPNCNYVWIMEPHKTGYPHLHVIIFGEVSEKAQQAIRRLWSKNYKAGSANHGVDFSVKSPEESIRSIKNYLLKYLGKTFTSTGSKFGTIDTWGPGELVFNALVWKNKWRLFGASRDLCKIMAHQKEKDENRKWFATEFVNADGQKNIVWQLMIPTGWNDCTQAYREIPIRLHCDEKCLD
jgi:hypothetical protein